MDGDEEKLAAMVRRVGSRSRVVAERGTCPDEEALAVYLGGSLALDERSRIEEHLSLCSSCADDVVAAYEAARSDNLDIIPPRLVEKAAALIPVRETLVDVTIRLIRNSIEIVSTSARVVQTPMPVLRGEAEPASGNMLQVEHEVGRFRVAVELDLTGAGTCQVVANVKEASGGPAEGVRLSLTSGEREQASFLTRHGVVVFDQLAPGEYSIAVSEAGTYLGKIRLNLMLEK
jgi:hypothetical protein